MVRVHHGAGRIRLRPPGYGGQPDWSGIRGECTANRRCDATERRRLFCSYHSKVFDAQTGQWVTYVVQPWSAFTICDEPDVPDGAPYAAPSAVETAPVSVS